MKKLNKRERILSIMILISVPLMYFTVVYPEQATKVKSLESSIQSEKAKLESQQIVLRDLTARVAQVQKSANANDEITKYLEANRHMSNLLRKLGADEQERGMMVKNIAVEQNKKLSNLYQTTMKVEVESSFVALGNFLGALADTDTLIDVKTVVLNRIDSDLKRCTAIIEVDGYYNEGPKL